MKASMIETLAYRQLYVKARMEIKQGNEAWNFMNYVRRKNFL